MVKPIVSLFIDNFDSYSYNIIYYLQKVNGIKPIVIFPDEINYDEFLEKYYNKIDNIIISPGYGNPEENKHNDLVINILKNNLNIPILGICYGHQLLCHFYGGKIKKVKNMFHGNINIIHIYKDENGKCCNLFNNIKNDFKATCYNSLKVSKHINTSILDITCYSIYLNEYILMGVKHKHLPYYSVQYHPESVVSEFSYQFFENFKNITIDYHNKNKTIRFKPLESDLFEKNQFYNIIKPVNNISNTPFDKCLTSEKKYELKIVKVVGIENLSNISYDIFQNVFYNKDDICFWLDSNNELLNNKDKKNDNIQNGIFNDLVNSSRFSYMGNAKGAISDVVEYYFVENEDSVIVNLKREDTYKTTSYFSDQSQNNSDNLNDQNNTYEYQEIRESDNCLVKYLNKKLEKYKNNFNINFSTFDINENIKNNKSEKLGIRIGNTNMQNNCNNSDCFYEKDDFIFNNKDTCLIGYIGLFNYEYKYETIKFLYNKNVEHVKNENNESLPVSFFIFPQHFIALDLVKNNLYLICLELTKGEEEETKDKLSNCSHEMKSDQAHKITNKEKVSYMDTKYDNIKKENEQWIHETIDKIMDIVNKWSDKKKEFSNQRNDNSEIKNKLIFSSTLTKDKYIENVKRCKDKIRNGYSYELCLTTSFKGNYYIPDDDSIDMLDLYKYLREINKVSYSCFINYNRKVCIKQNKYKYDRRAIGP